MYYAFWQLKERLGQHSKTIKERGVIILGRILVLEFADQDSSVFEEIMGVIKSHSGFEAYKFNDVQILSVSELDFYPAQKKVYYDAMEIALTVKEFDIFYLLAANKGHTLTYDQIYYKVWDEESIGNEKNAVKCHIRNLREKLYTVMSKPQFKIKCIRKVGYCFEDDS